MPTAGTGRRTLFGVAAALTVLAMAAITVAWTSAGSASATAGAGAEPTVPPPPTSTSSTTSSTTTSTTSSTSTSTTSTTVKPKPVTTTAKPRPTVPATTPATAPPTTRPAPVALPGNFTAEERCANARQWVAEHGLALPAGWGYRCPGQALENGTPRWGVACWNCNGDGQSWIAIDIGRIGASDKALRYVIAHEICHAIEYTTLGISTELTADLCAALHGAPR
jgi:hypothetical protein